MHVTKVGDMSCCMQTIVILAEDDSSHPHPSTAVRRYRKILRPKSSAGLEHGILTRQTLRLSFLALQVL